MFKGSEKDQIMKSRVNARDKCITWNADCSLLGSLILKDESLLFDPWMLDKKKKSEMKYNLMSIVITQTLFFFFL